MFCCQGTRILHSSIASPDCNILTTAAAATVLNESSLNPAGTSSTDPDGNDDIASYTFDVLLPGTTTRVVTKTSTDGKATLWFLSDKLSSNTKYTIQLTVTDKSAMTSLPVTQNLTVGNCNPTAAIANPTATVACGGSVTLDGSGSKDSDGTIASYAWKLVYGTQAISQSGATASLSQTTDQLASGQTYAVTLTVNDNLGGSNSINGVLTVVAGCVTNKPPVCSAAVASITRISTMVSE